MKQIARNLTDVEDGWAAAVFLPKRRVKLVPFVRRRSAIVVCAGSELVGHRPNRALDSAEIL